MVQQQCFKGLDRACKTFGSQNDHISHVYDCVGSLIQRGIEQVEKLPLSQGKESKPSEGISVGPEPTQKCPHEIKVFSVMVKDWNRIETCFSPSKMLYFTFEWKFSR